MLSLVPSLLILTLAGGAMAQADTPMAEAVNPAPRAYKQFTISLSPVHLTAPIVEVTGEYRPVPSWSVAVIGGSGSITLEETDGSTTKFTATEAGGQLRYYPFSPRRHEMNLGAELLWVHVSGDNINETDVSGVGAGIGIGPFVGYKYTAPFGLTFDSQIGYQKLFIEAEATDGSSSASGSSSDGIVLLNLNLGWSF